LYSPNNEKRAQLQEWLASSGAIKKTDIGSEIFKEKKAQEAGE
jgi:hypothetical protein